MSAAQTFLSVWYLAVNLIAFALLAGDKRGAVRHAWRIRERTLLLSAFAGGATGALAAMLLYRHKTRKAKFLILVPLAAFLHLFLAASVL